MKNDKVILITGGAGFLGSWLAEEAVKSGYSIIGIDIRGPLRPNLWLMFATSSCETVNLDQLLQGRNLFAVFHLAGGASVPSSVTDPYGDFDSLLPGTARLALYIAKNQPQARLILFSSAAVYGNPSVLPIVESADVTPVSPYGIHKALAENLLEHYSRVLNLKVITLRIFSVYGPGLRKQLIWDIGQKAFQAIKEGKNNIMLNGNGTESRDFIYVRDLCSAILLIIANNSDVNYEVYNLGSGTESKISDVANGLIKHLNVNTTVNYNNVVFSENPISWKADVSKLLNLGFRHNYSLSSGLKQVADWLTIVNDSDLNI